jgi:hypothetical protein
MKVKIGPYPNGKRKRKIDVHIDRYDTYGMDHTLALIILPMLIQLRATKHGIPHEFAAVGGEDYGSQDSFDFYKQTHDESFGKGCDRWDEVLDKMIWSFQQIIDEDYDSKYHHGEVDFEFKELTEKIYNPLTGKDEAACEMINRNKTHWYDYIGHREHEDRIQEGLALFGKHFRSLWD